MKNLIYVSILAMFVMAGCQGKKTIPADIQKFAGKWEITIKNLPKEGDKLLTTYLTPKDSILTGYFVETNGGRTELSSIEVAGSDMKCKFNWGGHNVSYKVELDENQPNLMSGRFLNIFKVVGEKK